MDAPKPQTPTKRNRTSRSPEQIQTARRQKFLKYAEKRVVNALKAIALVERLGNRKSFYYTQEQGDKIANTLLDAATGVRDAFQPAAEGKTLFTL